MNTTTTDLVGSAEVCEKLRISRATLSRRVAQGRIPVAHKLPGKQGGFVFHRDVIEALATAEKVSA